MVDKLKHFKTFDRSKYQIFLQPWWINWNILKHLVGPNYKIFSNHGGQILWHLIGIKFKIIFPIWSLFTWKWPGLENIDWKTWKSWGNFHVPKSKQPWVCDIRNVCKGRDPFLIKGFLYARVCLWSLIRLIISFLLVQYCHFFLNLSFFSVFFPFFPNFLSFFCHLTAWHFVTWQLVLS